MFPQISSSENDFISSPAIFLFREKMIDLIPLGLSTCVVETFATAVAETALPGARICYTTNRDGEEQEQQHSRRKCIAF